MSTIPALVAGIRGSARTSKGLVDAGKPTALEFLGSMVILTFCVERWPVKEPPRSFVLHLGGLHAEHPSEAPDVRKGDRVSFVQDLFVDSMT